ncbi:MAG: radical SAM protein [Erysipelotrichaceae bacterium]|nr:radical SAM protein [Erysipelotrichaceae bacterium]
MNTNAKLMDYLYSKASRKLIPLSGTFELSPVCNFSCRMCYVRKTQKEVKESPRPILKLSDWLRIAKEAREAGMLYLLLTGGEPLLWSDFWTLYDELIDMGFLISINTNGSLIDEKAVEHFKRKPPRQINITLYGANDDTYEKLCRAKGVFSEVNWAIRTLKEAGIVLRLNCSLTPQNVCDLDQMIQYSKEKELQMVAATYMFPPIRRDSSLIGVNERFTPEDSAKYRLKTYYLQTSEREYQEYLKKILSGYVEPPGLDEGCIDPIDGKVRCRAGKASFWITWDGYMTPCGMMPEPKVDLVNLPFSDSWKKITEETAQLCLSGVCDKCKNRNICNPCAAMAYAETGQSTGIPKYLCQAAVHMQKIAKETLKLDDETR